MPDVAMWGRALRVMPKVDKEEWDALDLVSRWLIATRSAVLVMTFTSAAFAGLLAAKDGVFDLGLWLLITFFFITLFYAMAAIGRCVLVTTTTLV